MKTTAEIIFLCFWLMQISLVATPIGGGILFFFFFSFWLKNIPSVLGANHKIFIPFNPRAYKHTCKTKYIIEMCLFTIHIVYLSYMKRVEWLIQLC